MDHMRRPIRRISGQPNLRIVINIGRTAYTTSRSSWRRCVILRFPYLGMNMDTATPSFAGQDPVEFLDRFKTGDHVISRT